MFMQLGVKLETRTCVQVIEECLVIRVVTYCDTALPFDTLLRQNGQGLDIQ